MAVCDAADDFNLPFVGHPAYLSDLVEDASLGVGDTQSLGQLTVNLSDSNVACAIGLLDGIDDEFPASVVVGSDQDSVGC